MLKGGEGGEMYTEGGEDGVDKFSRNGEGVAISFLFIAVSENKIDQ